MPIQHRTIGTGMTQREVIDVVPLTPEDFGEIRRLADPLVISKHPWEDLMAQLEAWAEDIVRNAALPLPVRKLVCVLPDGSWRDRMPGENRSCKSALKLVEERYGSDSLEWYAVQILSLLWDVRHYQTGEDWYQVGIIAAYRIGCLQTEVRMKNRWEVPALAGEKSLQGAKTSGEKHKDTTKSGQPRVQRDTEVLDEAKALHQQNPTYKDWKIAQRLARTQKNREVWNNLSVRQLYRILRKQ
jgi:hypothetical protein